MTTVPLNQKGFIVGQILKDAESFDPEGAALALSTLETLGIEKTEEVPEFPGMMALLLETACD